MMDTRKLDMIFFMATENGKNLTYEEIQDIAKKYSARSLWYLWHHTRRHHKYLSKQPKRSALERPHKMATCTLMMVSLMNERMVDIMTNTVKLQGMYGEQKAIRAGELKPGMVTVWNFGYKEVIKSIEPTKSGKSVKCAIICESGEELVRTMRIDRLVAIA